MEELGCSATCDDRAQHRGICCGLPGRRFHSGTSGRSDCAAWSAHAVPARRFHAGDSIERSGSAAAPVIGTRACGREWPHGVHGGWRRTTHRGTGSAAHSRRNRFPPAAHLTRVSFTDDAACDQPIGRTNFGDAPGHARDSVSLNAYRELDHRCSGNRPHALGAPLRRNRALFRSATRRPATPCLGDGGGRSRTNFDCSRTASRAQTKPAPPHQFAG